MSTTSISWSTLIIASHRIASLAFLCHLLGTHPQYLCVVSKTRSDIHSLSRVGWLVVPPPSLPPSELDPLYFCIIYFFLKNEIGLECNRYSYPVTKLIYIPRVCNRMEWIPLAPLVSPYAYIHTCNQSCYLCYFRIIYVITTYLIRLISTVHCVRHNN